MSEQEPDAQRDKSTVVSSASQLRALANEVRLRIVGLLRNRVWTMSELATELDLGKGSVSYHLKLLEHAGIARQVEGRTVRGGLQQSWSLTAPAIAVELDHENPGARAMVLRTLATQMEGATDQRLFVSHVRLSGEARQSAVAILEQALESIRGLESDTGRVVTLASVTFSQAEQGDTDD